MSKMTNPKVSLADPAGPLVCIANEILPVSCEAPWPEFLQCAGSAGARAHLKAMLTGIQKAYRTGDPRFRFLIQQHLTSFDARLAATRLAASKMRWYRRPKKTELKTIAGTLNAFQGTHEEVKLRLIRKGANTFRPTLDFGIGNRALQYLVLSVLYAIAELHPRQFATRGGVPVAIAHVMNAMKAGYVHVREIDIKDFYASFDRNKLVELVPVQKRVIDNVLLSEHQNIVPSALHHILSCFGPADTDQKELAPLEKYIADARRGIPQGSAASPLLAEMLLASLLFQVPAGGKVVAYADNILVMAKTASDADAMTESLGLALKKHPAGPLWPKITSFPAGGPIEFPRPPPYCSRRQGSRAAHPREPGKVRTQDEERVGTAQKANAGTRGAGQAGAGPEERSQLICFQFQTL